MIKFVYHKNFHTAFALEDFGILLFSLNSFLRFVICERFLIEERQWVKSFIIILFRHRNVSNKRESNENLIF